MEVETGFKQLSVGKAHAAAITSDGKLLTWGDSDNGKLGHKPEEKSKSAYRPKNYADNSKIGYVDIENVVQVSCGS